MAYFSSLNFDFVFIFAGLGFKFYSMLPLILRSFRLDVGSELVPFWLHSGSSLEPFGSILAPLLFHLGSILEPFGSF